jgi:hypothetical protein
LELAQESKYGMNPLLDLEKTLDPWGGGKKPFLKRTSGKLIFL